MRFHLGLGSKAKRFFVSCPPRKKPELNGEIKSRPDYGSKEESFFDSRACFDSDCEDDFFSVNGDFTPSRGTTPNHQFSTAANKIFTSDTFPDSKSERSPTGKKKLSELLQESLHTERMANGHNENIVDSKNVSNIKQEVHKLDDRGQEAHKSANVTPYFSGTNSVCGSEAMTPNRYKKERKSSNCCLPSLLMPSLSFSDRKKHKLSSEHDSG